MVSDASGGIPARTVTGPSATTRLLGTAWGVSLAAGLLTLGLGIMVVAWPEATIKVVAWLFGLQLLILGVFRIVQAIVADDSGGARVLYALLGVLSVLVGVLVLRHLLQTVVVLALLLGTFWLVGGILEFINAVTDRHSEHRGWAIVLSLLSAIAGIVVLTWPGMTLLTLTVLTGIWFITWGLLISGMALWLRYGAD
ncbi:HdeD family acid-resistance protein [Spirillospora sp. NPDC048911]|uniref:HdeD family acid-resistance protein n=1 Tax=Spirillospora sp. NPDC048911 TaxID=3364527 RepID=UPI0037172C9B